MIPAISKSIIFSYFYGNPFELIILGWEPYDIPFWIKSNLSSSIGNRTSSILISS